MAEVCLGVDVGGTNTDAVVLSGRQVLAQAKHVTTQDVTSGVIRAIVDALRGTTIAGYECLVRRVNIGTTHLVNAVVQRKGLAKVSVIRLCGTASRALPPLSDFPADLKKVIGGSIHMLNGGYQFDGRTPITEINEAEVIQQIDLLKSSKVGHVVVSGIFSPVNNAQEKLVAGLIRDRAPEISVTLSHEIGDLGLLERENAAVLNACLRPLCCLTVLALRQALHTLGLNCPLFLTQNDGTVISSELAMKYPVLTFASGPTNSMRGAAFLSGVADAVVIDVGGTTCDVGVLTAGFPREASLHYKVGSVRTNFRMPDVLSIGLGGGSHVNQIKENHGNAGSVRVGPLSTGSLLTSHSRVFGGHTLTATDVAVAAGRLNIGDASLVQNLPSDLIKATMTEIQTMIEEAVDQVKVKAAAVPVVLVGGGAILIDDKKNLVGTSHVIKPQHFDVANAVGAALSQVSGQADHVVYLDEVNRDEALQQAKQTALDAAVASGANPSTVQIKEITETPVAYLPGNVSRIKVKAVGDLAQESDGQRSAVDDALLKSATEELEKRCVASVQQATSTGGLLHSKDYDTESFSIGVQPYIDPSTGEWVVSEYDIDCISIGAGILGCGGGGSPSMGRLRAKKKIQEGKVMRIISCERLGKECSDTDQVGVAAFMGAPMILVEKLISGTEIEASLQCLQDLHNVGGYHDSKLSKTDGLHIKHDSGKTYIDDFKPDLGSKKMPSENTTYNLKGLLCAEIAGFNALEPLITGSELDLPVVDCDGMGRAFPELQMFVPFIYNTRPVPATLSDDKLRRAAILDAQTAKQVEDHFRVQCVDMGCSAAFSFGIAVDKLKSLTVQHSYSRVWNLGHSVLQARRKKSNVTKVILERENGTLLCEGKICDVERRTEGGFNFGVFMIEGTGSYHGKTMKIDFQNENLVAWEKQEYQWKVLACTPDLICIIEKDRGEPIQTEELRYGLRVSAIVLPAPAILRTPQALSVVGPQAFGYLDDVQFEPNGEPFNCQPIPPV